MSARKGWTLVELLVVLAVVGLLVGMLVPSLRTARERACMASCASAMRAAHQVQSASDDGITATMMGRNGGGVGTVGAEHNRNRLLAHQLTSGRLSAADPAIQAM